MGLQGYIAGFTCLRLLLIISSMKDDQKEYLALDIYLYCTDNIGTVLDAKSRASSLGSSPQPTVPQSLVSKARNKTRQLNQQVHARLNLLNE